MRDALALIPCSLLLAGVTTHGCRGGDRVAKVEELSVLDGISVFEFDGLNLRIKRAAGANDRILVVNGRGVEQVDLRVGEGFVITNGRDQHEAYHVLAASGEWVTLRRETLFDRRASGEGTRTLQDVIALKPYNLENADRRQRRKSQP